MNPLRRLWIVIKARFSSSSIALRILDDLLDYSYEKQLEDLNEFRQGLAGLVAAKKRVQTRKENLEREVMKLDKAAHSAVGLGDEEKARIFLERKQFLQDELAGVDREVEDLEAQQERMIKQERDVQAKVERFRTEKEVSKAQYTAAKARVSAGEAAAGIASASNEGGQAMMRAKDKVEQMRATRRGAGRARAGGLVHRHIRRRVLDRPSDRRADLDRRGRGGAAEDQARGPGFRGRQGCRRNRRGLMRPGASSTPASPPTSAPPRAR